MKIINIKILQIILASILLISISSCEKLLETELNDRIPNDMAINSTRDLQLILNGAYDGLQSSSVLGGNPLIYADLLSDDTKIGNEQKLNRFGKYEIYTMISSPQIGEIASFWSTAYSAINRANNVIYAIDNKLVSDADFDVLKNHLKGEALFIRAVCHFELVRFFAKPYNVNQIGANNQMGIPYKITPSTNPDSLNIKRASVETIYNNIIADLQESKTLLENAGAMTSTSHASAMSATAMLARVCFFKGNYILASDYSNQVILSSYFELADDISEVFKLSGSEYNPEVIFQIVNIRTDNSNSLIDAYSRAKNPLFQTDADIYNMYDENDTRRNLITKYFVLYYIKKYDESIVEGMSQPLNRVYIRLAEMHLIRAESNLIAGGAGNSTYAFDSYNALRERAFADNYSPESVTLGNLLDSVQMERRRELCFEGDRYHNLKRLQKPLRNGVDWNADAPIFKIPADEMSGNNLMEQNP
ncbi:MAG: RagB/SusD family nutrient uptake outer membrane protein [Bacteroidales bacterium]|nr:RagB/SusD family nutrient uptake outer membrane protein [Bacteroidales bacterium]MDD4216172.1 RagB/SusD family nutrient uptake outer membrane protein [Bacteroidales bacterium]MDY0141779.1 RagB/SusD family nutrient uptake outer membrane protein [Bacteroidales bacterium]